MAIIEKSFSDILAAKLFLPAYNFLKRDESFKYCDAVEDFNKKSLDAIRDHQLDRIRQIAAHAYRHTRYYRELFDRLGILDPGRLTWDDYRAIPVLTKEIIRTRKDDLLSSNAPKSTLRETATGGTTSSPTAFYSDWDSTFRKRSATVVFDAWLGFHPGMKSALLWGAFQDFVGVKTLKQKVINHLVQRRMLCDFKPYLLQSYPAPLGIFADFLQRKSYRLEIPALSCTAEPLVEHQKQIITEAFGKQPCNWYGAREAGRIATECGEHRGMHVNAYCLHLDIDRSNYAAGELGSILITDLWNTGMPLIRYEIGDVGAITEEACPCGCRLPRIADLMGRVTDTFVNSKGQKIPGVGFTNRYIKDAREIRAMQIIQHGIKDFEIVVVAAEEFGPATELWLHKKLDEFMLEPTDLRITAAQEIRREKSGKVRFCKNLM
jgi:phenylacetate-CoA ligase